MRRRALYVVLILMFAARLAAAQTSSGGSSNPADPPWKIIARHLLNPEDEVSPFRVVFGGIKPGAGASAGPEVTYAFDNGSLVNARAEYSIHNYKLLQTEFHSRPFGPWHAVISSRVRWQDAPSVPLYEPGADSPENRALYAERKTEYSAEGTLHPNSVSTIAAAIGDERFRLGGGRTDPHEDEALAIVPMLAGLGTNPHFFHVFVAAGIDTRPSGDVSRRGFHTNAALHHYSDLSGGTFSFSQFVLEGEQLIPLSRDRGALSFAGNLWTSEGTTVPFYLMPTLGGGDYLRGYRTYRFRDRDAAVITAQLQWRLHERIDGVAFVDAGAVAPRLTSLDDGTLPLTEGIGVRLRTPRRTVFRLDLARSVEGLQLLIGFSARASAVF